MNTIKMISLRMLGLSLAILLSSASAFCLPQVSMSLRNITTSSNSIEYDLYMVNGTEANIRLAGFSFGVNFDETIINGGKLTYSFLSSTGSKPSIISPKMAVTITAGKRLSQARLTTGNSPFEQAVELQPQKPFKVGRFRIENSNKWTANSNPNFGLQELFAKGKTNCAVLVFLEEGTETSILHMGNDMIETQVDKCPVLNPSGMQIAMNSKENSLLSVDYSIEVFPNPVTDNLHVNYFAKSSSIELIQIFDLQGRLVQSERTSIAEGSNTFTLNVQTLHKGMYILKLGNAGGQAISRTFSKM